MMRKDAAITWNNGFPYDVLAEADITPASSMKTIRDALFRIPKERRAAARQAIRQVDEISKRLVVDFFLYQGTVRPQEDQNGH